MKNVLLQACRAMRGYNERQIAAKLGMKPEDYVELETGAIIMTSAQAEWLSDAYGIGRKFFLESSQQLDLLLTRTEVIKQLQSENEYQQSELERLRTFIFIHKELLLDSQAGDETEVTH
jgi:transcriptional regulator with XRE-family HTH domain